jgi:hypothetical protein
MPVEMLDPDPRYGKVHLVDPAPLGYLHLAADVEAAHRPDCVGVWPPPMTASTMARHASRWPGRSICCRIIGARMAA